MRKTVLLLLFVIAFLGVKSQDKTILITETGLPYTSQSWFYSGRGNALQEDKIKKNWDEGRRITSVAYTDNGWFVTMAKNTGIGMQSYSYTADWPEDWIDKQWNENYSITSISKGNGKWMVVMSKGSGFSTQSYWRNSWEKLRPWIKEKRNEGYMITSVAYDGSYWTVVLSKGSPYSAQGYLWADSYDELVSKVKKEIWDKSDRIHLMEYGEGYYLVVYGNYSQNNGRGQYFHVNPSDVSEYIDKKWKESYNIAQIGGGYASQSSDTRNVNTNYGKRTGQMYYTNERSQLADFNFYYNNGEYLIQTSLTEMAYGYFPRYVLRQETADSYIFYKCKVHINSLEVQEYMPKLIVSKDWSKIVVESTMVGKMVLTKEISKSEYDKIKQAKNNLLYGGGYMPSPNNNNNNNDNGSSYRDKPCQYCGGGGGCSSCKGTGLKYNTYSGGYDTCPSCGGNARCFNCRGTGKQATY